MGLANVLAGPGFYLLAGITCSGCFLNHTATIPGIAQAPASAMQKSFFLGMAYGIGGTAFGIAIRYVGFSLTYAIAVGISCVLGTLLPPLVHGTLGDVLKSNGAGYLFSGVFMGAIGIALCGIAGRNKEKDLEKTQNGKSEFSLAKGLPFVF